MIGLAVSVMWLAVVCLFSALAGSMYGSERMFRRDYVELGSQGSGKYRPIENVKMPSLSEQQDPFITVHFRQCSLEELRGLEKIYHGKPVGEEIYEIRKQRILQERTGVHRKIAEEEVKREKIIADFEHLVLKGSLSNEERLRLKNFLSKE